MGNLNQRTETRSYYVCSSVALVPPKWAIAALQLKVHLRKLFTSNLIDQRDAAEEWTVECLIKYNNSISVQGKEWTPSVYSGAIQWLVSTLTLNRLLCGYKEQVQTIPCRGSSVQNTAYQNRINLPEAPLDSAQANDLIIGRSRRFN